MDKPPMQNKDDTSYEDKLQNILDSSPPHKETTNSGDFFLGLFAAVCVGFVLFLVSMTSSNLALIGTLAVVISVIFFAVKGRRYISYGLVAGCFIIPMIIFGSCLFFIRL